SFATYSSQPPTTTSSHTLTQSLPAPPPPQHIPLFPYTTLFRSDGTLTSVTINILGSNDNATITTSVSEDNAVLEDGGVANATAEVASAPGSTPVQVADSGANYLQTNTSLAGSYGSSSMNTTSGT